MTKVTEMNIAVVTGASSGIAEAVVQRLTVKGITTYAAARRLDRMEHLKQSGVRILRLRPNGTLEPQVTTRVWETI
jgi:NADP-dependent 3-hydroxy acid dehydrogenase YdfG